MKVYIFDKISCNTIYTISIESAYSNFSPDYDAEIIVKFNSKISV